MLNYVTCPRSQSQCVQGGPNTARCLVDKRKESTPHPCQWPRGWSCPLLPTGSWIFPEVGQSQGHALRHGGQKSRSLPLRLPLRNLSSACGIPAVTARGWKPSLPHYMGLTRLQAVTFRQLTLPRTLSPAGSLSINIELSPVPGTKEAKMRPLPWVPGDEMRCSH